MLRGLYNFSLQVNAISQREASWGCAIIVPLKNNQKFVRIDPMLRLEAGVSRIEKYGCPSIAGQDHLFQVYFPDCRCLIYVAPRVGAARRIIDEKESAIWSPGNIKTTLVFLYRFIVRRPLLDHPVHKLSFCPIYRCRNRNDSQLPSAVQPPSTTSACPFTNPLCISSARKRIARAMSSGEANLPIGTRPVTSASV